MIYRIPFVYTVAGTLKGHRKVEPHLYGDWVDVEIPHVVARDAPVSMSWNQDFPAQEPLRHELRWHEDGNWIRAFSDSGHRDPIHFVADDFARLAESETQHIRNRTGSSHLELLAKVTGQDRYTLRGFVCGTTYREHGIKEYDPSTMRQHFYNNRAEIEAEVTAKARNLLFIDGSLWVRGGEPCYAVHSYQRGRVEIFPSTTSIPEAWNVVANNFFRADRLEDALDLASELAGGTEARAPELIEVLISEAVQFDDEGEALLRASRQAVDKGTELLRNGSAERVTAWLALREALKAEHPNLDDAMACLRRLGDQMHETSDIRKAADHVERRWNLRPLDNSLLFR